MKIWIIISHLVTTLTAIHFILSHISNCIVRVQGHLKFFSVLQCHNEKYQGQFFLFLITKKVWTEIKILENSSSN